jgi:choline dehydrogenase-like flavoprotein
MRIYVGNHGDTLRSLSRKFEIGIDKLLSLNPHISAPDVTIRGLQVQFPPQDQTLTLGAPPPAVTDFLKHWIPLTTPEEMAAKEYDVLIAGSGAGGGAVLWRLCSQWAQSGKRIGVVEAGDLLLPTHARNIPVMNSERLAKYFKNPQFSRVTPPYASREIIALGGRTLFWLNVSPRMHPSDIGEWPISIPEIEVYYNIAERIMHVTQEYNRASSITQILLNRLRAGGFPDAIEQPIAVDMEQTHYGEIHSNVFFSSMNFLAEALNRQSFDLAVKSPAVEVLVDKGKAAGLRVMTSDRNSHYIKAKTVILSASAFQSPRILLNSRIPGPAIGHYLTNHTRVFANGMVKRSDFPEKLGTLGILVPGREDRSYQIQIIGPGSFFWYQPYEVKPLKEEWEIALHASGEVESRYENRVELDPGKHDIYGIPEIQIHFSYSPKDLMLTQQMAGALRQAALAMNAPLIPQDQQPSITLWPPGQEFHEMGTCRMGVDPYTSATNSFGQIHGVSGLYVADNSIIPTSGTANPTLTTVALAIRTADYIVQQMK